MKKGIGLQLIGLAALLVSSAAVAQLQPQGVTVGSPPVDGSPPTLGSPAPLTPRPTRASCTRQANQRHLRGSRRTTFIRRCLKG